MPEFLSPEAFDFAWSQYQTFLVDKLNLLTQGTSVRLRCGNSTFQRREIYSTQHRRDTDTASTDTVDADAKPGELLVKYSKRPEMASVFNYASMAHNNHFFFNCLVSSTVMLPK